MKDLNKKRKAAIIISWAFVAACLIIIFKFSNETASQSSETSDGIIAKIIEWFNLSLSEDFVRSCAHCIEFAGLCFAFNTAYLSTYFKYNPLLSFVSTFFCSCVDEIHQFFIEGRACQIKDLLIDSSGAAATVIILSAFYLIYKKYCQKRGKLCPF